MLIHLDLRWLDFQGPDSLNLRKHLTVGGFSRILSGFCCPFSLCCSSSVAKSFSICVNCLSFMTLVEVTGFLTQHSVFLQAPLGLL